MNIYDLNKEQEGLINELYFNEDDESLRIRLNDIRGQIKNKLQYLSTVLLELKAQEAARKDAVQKATARLRTAQNATERLKNFIFEQMLYSDIKKLDCDLCNLSINKGKEEPVFNNVDDVPEQFKERIETVKVDKKSLLEWAKENPSDKIKVIRKPFLTLR